MGATKCRFFENEFPEVDECVMVRVESIAEMGAYVRLLEYGGIEGMVLLSELSRRRIRSINKLLRVNTNEVVMVTRVDREKGYIDLSKRRVSSEERTVAETRFTEAKAVQSILMHAAEKTKQPLEDLCRRISWPLAKAYPSAYEAFTIAANKPEEVFGPLDMSEAEKQEVLVQIERRMTPSPIKMRADVEVTCIAYEGVDAVREALLAGKASTADSDCPVAVNLVSPPSYALTTVHLSKEVGFASLQTCIDTIKATLEAKGGRLTVVNEPYALTVEDEKPVGSDSDSE